MNWRIGTTAFTNLREKRDLKAMFLPNGEGWAS